MNRLEILTTAIVVAIIAAIIYIGSCFHRVEKHECGFVFNRFTGEIQPLDRQGWFIRMQPKYTIHAIDCRPYQIRITADTNVGERILNAKLVRFNPKGIDEFVRCHGRDAGDDVKKLCEIFKCYAFAPDGGVNCPFIEVMSETKPTTQQPEKT